MGIQEHDEDLDVATEEADGSGTIPVGSSPDDFRILEAVLFASDELLTAAHLKSIIPGQPDARKIRGMVEKINVQLQKERHPFEIVEIGGGYQFRTITYYHPWVRQIFKEKASKKLSIQSLECLAIISYKQPISKAEIESVRGVVSDGAMKTLLEKRLVTVSGRSDKPGRPLLYGTTQTFLTYFGLNKIEDLPRIEEFEAMAREKMEELSLDELAAPEAVIDEDADGPAGQNIPGGAESTVPTPVESSVFELEITPDGKSDASRQSGESGAEIAATATTPGVENTDSDEEFAFEIGSDPAGSETAAPAADDPVPAAEEKAPERERKNASSTSLPVEGETAFDLESIVADEPAPPPAPVKAEQSKKERRTELEGMILRGETAFDLEAIVIEDPQINFPPSAAKKDADDTATTNKVSINETAFDIDLMPKAPPKKQPVDDAGTDAKKPAADPAMVQSGKKEPLHAPSTEFEFNAPFAASDSIVAPDNGENEVSFEPVAALPAASAKTTDTAYFELDASSDAIHDPEACDRLAEELKETTFIRPIEVAKNPAGKAGGKRKKSIERGKGKTPPAAKNDTVSDDTSGQSDNA